MKLKKDLTILVIGEWDFAGCGYFLSQAINQHTTNTARCVRLHQSTFGYPFDIQDPSDTELSNLWKRADVIHIHDDYRKLPPNLQAKPTVVTYHGSLYRAAPKTYDDTAKALGWIQTAATLDLTLLGPRWLPDTRPDLAQYVNRSPEFKACHAPTKRKVKGTAEVIAACRKLVDLDVIENTQWDEALKRKGQCWITLDQFQLGYGCNAIEAWLMGQPVVGGTTDKRVLGLIQKQLGYLPMVLADENVASIREQVTRLKDDKAFYTQAQQRGADYVQRLHSYQAVAERALEFYHEAIETFYSRGVAYVPVEFHDIQTVRKSSPVEKPKPKLVPQPSSSMLLIEYLGTSVGWVQFTVNGRQYKFSAAHPIQPVDLADVRTFLTMRDLPKRKVGKREKIPGKLLFRRAE